MNFAKLVGCAAAASAVGFVDFVGFVSTGYGGAMAVQSIADLLAHKEKAPRSAVAQGLGVLAYGIRLTVYLLRRSRKPSYKKAVGERTKEKTQNIKLPAKVLTWGAVSTLYACMFLPTHAALRQGQSSRTAGFGLSLLFAGLALEWKADEQKSTAKEKQPDKFVDSGLYKYSQHPNYLGEVLFWLGNFVAGAGADQSAVERVAGGVGLLSIVSIIAAETKQQHNKQTQRYGSDPAFQDYDRKTPLLLPFTKRGTKPAKQVATQPAETGAATDLACGEGNIAKAATTMAAETGASDISAAAAAEPNKKAGTSPLAPAPALQAAKDVAKEEPELAGAAPIPTPPAAPRAVPAPLSPPVEQAAPSEPQQAAGLDPAPAAAAAAVEPADSENQGPASSSLAAALARKQEQPEHAQAAEDDAMVAQDKAQDVAAEEDAVVAGDGAQDVDAEVPGMADAVAEADVEEGKGGDAAEETTAEAVTTTAGTVTAAQKPAGETGAASAAKSNGASKGSSGNKAGGGKKKNKKAKK